jgi:hypothetical protein
MKKSDKKCCDIITLSLCHEYIGTENKRKNRRTRCDHKVTEHEFLDRTGRTGQPGQDSLGRTARTAQLGQNS